jgi:ceramide glucosyltransferase
MIAFLFAGLAGLSVAITLWQWLAARRFPLHRRLDAPAVAPPVTLLKPLKGRDADTGLCLASWLSQKYSGPVQVLFGVDSPDDPVAETVRELMAVYPEAGARLVVCSEALGPNSKVSTLIQLQQWAIHDLIVISDADVRAPADLLANVVPPLGNPEVGLVNCFYGLAYPSTLAMQWEAIAINADFWGQVLQSRSLKPMDFALGAVMATTRRRLEAIGGFESLVECLADDYQLGNRIARGGKKIELCPVVVDCWESPRTWRQVWRHQLRWARTIRVCQPGPYFWSILGNATFWPLIWLVMSWATRTPPSGEAGTGASTAFALPDPLLPVVCGWMARMFAAMDCWSRLSRSCGHWIWFWLVPIKDLLAVGIWFTSFLGNRIEWRDRRYRVLRGGRLERIS